MAHRTRGLAVHPVGMLECVYTFRVKLISYSFSGGCHFPRTPCLPERPRHRAARGFSLVVPCRAHHADRVRNRHFTVCQSQPRDEEA